MWGAVPTLPAVADEAKVVACNEVGGRGDFGKYNFVFDMVCPLDVLCVTVHTTEARVDSFLQGLVDGPGGGAVGKDRDNQKIDELFSYV